MALEIGAAPCGDFGSFHAQPVDPRSPDIEPVVLNYNFGVLINDSGHRFTDEGPAMVDATYEVVTRLIMGREMVSLTPYSMHLLTTLRIGK